MSGRTYYQLGLCSSEDAHSLFYLSVAKHGLPNAFPGYYSIVNSEKPGVVFITLDPNGHVKEPSENDDDQTPQINHSVRSTPVTNLTQNRWSTNRPPMPPSAELKPTILQAVMGNPIQNPQQNLIPTRQRGNINPSQSFNRETIRPIISPLKPATLPKPSTSQPFPVTSQETTVVRTPSRVTWSRDVVGTTPSERIQAGSQPRRKKNPAPAPPVNVAYSPFRTGSFNASTTTPNPPKPTTLGGIFPPPIPPPNINSITTNQRLSTGISSDLLNSIHSFNKNNLRPASNSARGQVKTTSFRQTENPLFNSLRNSIRSIRVAHSDSGDETENNERHDNYWP